MRGRKLKQLLLDLLKKPDVDESLDAVRRLPLRRVISPLLSFFYASDELVKWRAINALGVVVSDLAGEDMEAARVVMRRLMWNLNDESGGIGWGSPEAMGEIMARHKKLADEYGCILTSYIREDGNFIEHEILQRGVLWGIGRLAHVRPELLVDAVPFLAPYLTSKDAMVRALAAYAAGALPDERTKPLLQNLTNDTAKISVFLDGRLVQCSVGQLAKDALPIECTPLLEGGHGLSGQSPYGSRIKK